jgi:hypothetical protein
VGGSLVGGPDENGGAIYSQGDMGAVRIAGNVVGRGFGAGAIRSFQGSIASVTIGGSLIGGIRDGTGVILASSGAAGPIRIRGNIVVGSISAGDLNQSGYVEARRIASVFVGGSVIAGVDQSAGMLAQSGSIRAGEDLGPVTVMGSLGGNSTNPVVISAGGQAEPTATTDLAIASLTVGGRVEFADILAGYNTNLDPVNADAQVGAVVVGLDWIASNLAAGVEAGTDGFFGTADALIAEADASPTITAAIASVVINSQALGTVGSVDPNVPDHYGIVAELVGALQLGRRSLPLTRGAGNDDLALGATGDFRLLEL